MISQSIAITKPAGGYIKPVRRVLSPDDLNKWIGSLSYTQVVDFVEQLSLAVKGKENDAPCNVSESVNQILHILDKVGDIIELHPVIQDKETSRFGKIEFRDFYDEITLKSNDLLLGISDLGPLIDSTQDPRIELCVYFNESWGNRTRIDYGSGHELNFICFLLCLKNLNILNLDWDATAIVLKIFIKYLSVMRILQKKYWLEPAGSHGVWGLDDYHFLPFLFGASQLSLHKHLKPKSIHDKDYIEMFENKYMYFHCIAFINDVKTASLRWHSPMLDDISGVKTWKKVAEGMVKMYKGEVLNRLPIIQHFFFGNIIKAPEGVSKNRVTKYDYESDHKNRLPGGHIHTWGDCCGIKIPSAIAASEMLKKKEGHRIPFD
ncbi:peptidylprolyl isomerase RRD2 [Ascoidea rubescens DSM 1968]|uniref:Serine/threonine-protein phosphatase 2A activator n=1 Tax=Ascoidea rubescens DSM 1968 TaxID=1344418 RepID=A0A1D2VF30_9ASCO|nr:rotamase PTPA-2 [Ascoidea rubescens DSM 1968]ODV60236.1 rotamase PTPA-2 [Ascoidea rubescens DSM 1968]